MKLKCFACLVVGTLGFVAQAIANPPTVTPFLSVDLNGANYGGGQTVGPTEAGFQPWNMFQGFDATDSAYLPSEDWGNSGAAGLTKVFGSVTANLKGIAPGSNLGARNRGGAVGAYPLHDVLSDMAFAQNNTTVPADFNVGPSGGGFGQNFVRLQLDGLIPGQAYQLTMLSREQAFNDAARNAGQPHAAYMAWTDKSALGGLDGPGAWLNANVGINKTYQGIYEDIGSPAVETNTGYKNPIPTRGRSPISGQDLPNNPYWWGSSFRTVADASGEIVAYGWSDANKYSGNDIQRASVISGFQVGVVPEPASLVLCAIGLVGFAGLVRRMR